MGYSVDPSALSSIFPVPASVADEHLKFASGQQLKVLLYLLRAGSECSAEQIGKGVAMSSDDVKDAMQYWCCKGIVCADGRSRYMQQEQVQGGKIPDIAPSHEEIAERLSCDPSLAGMFNEIQKIQGKTLGYSAQSQLILITETYGMAPEIVVMIAKYAQLCGKGSIGYIKTVAKDWSERGINTFYECEAEIEKLENKKALWKEFEAMISADKPKFTDSRYAYLDKWYNVYGFPLDLIYLAYEKTVDNTNSQNFSYTDKIIESWKAQGVKTAKQAIAASVSAKQQKNSAKTNTDASYDKERYKLKSDAPVKYERKNK